MNRDAAKTLAGLAIIGVIVVATFLYGNAQRQAQLKKDEGKAGEQVAKVSPTVAAKVTVSPSASPRVSPTPTPRPTASVTPVPAITHGPVAGASAAMPATGPELVWAAGLAAMVGSFGLWRRSRRLAAERISIRR